MRISMKPIRPFQCAAPTKPIQPPLRFNRKLDMLIKKTPENWERSLLGFDTARESIRFSSKPDRLNSRWMEYQGVRNWEGMLDPLDDNLRKEIIRYGHFVDAAYKAFDFNPTSSSYSTCRYPKKWLLERSGLPETGYRVTKNLHATSGIELPHWMEKVPRWMGIQSSWIGYVAVSNDREEIARLGRRDIVISYRGTATCLEWLENLRTTLTQLPNVGPHEYVPMVESGFLSLYTSKTKTRPSLQHFVKEEIKKLLEVYGDKPFSLTVTGHSLGAALATLTAYDIKTTFRHMPLVTVISFGGPRVGNRSFRHHLENQGTKVLRIVNPDDVVTRVPGFLTHEESNRLVQMPYLPSWMQPPGRSQWAYADVGRELRLSSEASPHLSRGFNVAACHELKTYLHLVNGFVSSKCPLRPMPRR